MDSNTKRPLIGIITASACQSEQRQILDGIIEQAQKLGADTAIFSNIYNSSEYYANIDEENKIYDLVVSKKLDGLILTAESILNTQLQQYIYQKIICRSDIPVVVTRAKLPDFPCINNDVETDIEKIADHLIEKHHFTDIDMLTGPSDNESSHERVNGYKRSLFAHGIPFEESKIIYGDFWMTSGEALAKEYISGKRRLPQAVVCGNDYMAYGLCDTLILNGISIPDDLTIMGYEYVGERFYHAPILTTYQRNRQGIGARTVNQLWHMMTGTETEPVCTEGFLVPGNSCPCGADDQQIYRELSTVRREQYYNRLNLTGNFEQQLTLCSSVKDYVHTLQEFTYLIRDVIGVYLCLREDWCQSHISSVSSTAWDTKLMICYRVIGPEPIKEEDEESFFHLPDLNPDTMIKTDNGSVLYFCPVFFAGETLGYFILQYDHSDSYDIIFRDWLKIASNALEMLRMKNDIHTLLACRDLSALHDSVTGLYNENGLVHELKHALDHAKPEDTVILVLIRSALFTDKSNLKDSRTYVQIDLKIAESLQKAASGENGFCAKFNDNLYAFAAVGAYSEMYETLLADKLKILVQQASLHNGGKYALDSLIICRHHESVRDFNFEKVTREIQEEMNQKINMISEKKMNNNYADYLELRNKIYLDPQNDWDAQKTCYDFCLSCGHFRAVYKEIFGISFHQDVIQSRISLAKHLLITTKMNISSIANRCGYDNDKHFMHQFKQTVGITPNIYRINI